MSIKYFVTGFITGILSYHLIKKYSITYFMNNKNDDKLNDNVKRINNKIIFN